MARKVALIVGERPFLLRGGERVEAGALIELEPRDAAEVLDYGKAKLADPDDLAAVNVARQEAINETMRRASRVVVENALPEWMPAGPWRLRT